MAFSAEKPAPLATTLLPDRSTAVQRSLQLLRVASASNFRPSISTVSSRYGVIVSPSFAGIDEELRQEQLYERVEKELGAEAVRKLLFLFTNTPAEDALFKRHEDASRV